MSIRKRYKKNKKVFYEAQVYVRGVRLAYRCFDSRAEAHSWHDQQKEKLEVNPGSLKRQKQQENICGGVGALQERGYSLPAKSNSAVLQTSLPVFCG